MTLFLLVTGVCQSLNELGVVSVTKKWSGQNRTSRTALATALRWEWEKRREILLSAIKIHTIFISAECRVKSKISHLDIQKLFAICS